MMPTEVVVTLLEPIQRIRLSIEAGKQNFGWAMRLPVAFDVALMTVVVVKEMIVAASMIELPAAPVLVEAAIELPVAPVPIEAAEIADEITTTVTRIGAALEVPVAPVVHVVASVAGHRVVIDATRLATT